VRSPFLQPTREPSHTRHRGFLAVGQRVLAFGALLFSGSLLVIPVLPASAEFASESVETVEVQTFTAPDEVVVAAGDDDATAAALSKTAEVAESDTQELREDFTFSEYSIVQSPVAAGTPMGDGFGYRVPPCSGCSSYHKGVDWNPGAGTGVHAMSDGVVTEIGNPSGSLGVYVVVAHKIDGQSITTVYAHMASGSMTLNVGDKVSAGQIVGAVGSTGQSTGPHLYFELRVGGTPVDPIPWLAAHINA
jgi:murein DD-endopeptidase MepM/ murein hydrolase activator NlpD